MVTLYDSRDRTHPRNMAVATRETVRTNDDGTVTVDDPEYVETLKAAGFKETDETADAEDAEGEDLEDLPIGELREKAKEAGIAEETDLRSKGTIVEALRDATGE